MDVILIMCAGVLVGAKWFPERHQKKLSLFQLLTPLCLIFSMGVMLGSRQGFLEEITTLGWESFLFFLLPTVCSVLIVYPLTRIFMKEHIKKKEE